MPGTRATAGVFGGVGGGGPDTGHAGGVLCVWRRDDGAGRGELLVVTKRWFHVGMGVGSCGPGN